jgi:hypothetical protein
MFGRRPPKPDPALLARVSDAAEVDLGTYPEDALAVTGAYPARGGLDHLAEGPSAFRRLDSPSRKAAMQAALDRLAAAGTIDVPAGSSLEAVVSAGLDGKLAVTGPLADLYRLSLWFHRQGFQSSMVVSMTAKGGLTSARMPPGVPPPGLENCFGLPPGGDGAPVLLVERPDNEAGARSYTLRTPRREFARMAAFLFADVTTGGEALLAVAEMRFRFDREFLKVATSFIRKDGEDVAYGLMTVETPEKMKGKQQEERYLKVSASELADAVTEYFLAASSRTQ